MKKSVYYLLCSASLCAPSTFFACQRAKIAPSQTANPMQARLLSERSVDDFEAQFEFSPLPQEEGIFDLSEVDISDIDPARKLISFTFDDAPASTIENILAAFATYNENNPDCKATATLFCNGYLMEEETFPTLTAALALGWELGNHTYSHPDVTTLSPSDYAAELAKTEGLLKRVDGKRAHLFRAPYGRITDEYKAAANAPVIHWTIDTLDWQNKSEDEIYNTVFEEKFSGAIVLMHDGYPHTVSALKRLLPDLKEAGYQVVSVSQMAKAHGCTLKNGSHYIRARKRGNGV